jgi:hypothetical protein
MIETRATLNSGTEDIARETTDIAIPMTHIPV